MREPARWVQQQGDNKSQSSRWQRDRGTRQRGRAQGGRLGESEVKRRRVWYNVKVMAHTVIPDQPAPDTGIMAWSRYLSELEKLPQDDEGVRLAIQGARDMIAELEWLEPEGGEEV